MWVVWRQRDALFVQVALFYGTADSCEVVVHSVEVDAAARTEVPSLVGKRTPVAVFLNWNDFGYVKVRPSELGCVVCVATCNAL